MKQILFISAFFILYSTLPSPAQLSEGGSPRNVIHLKSGRATTEYMPEVSNEVLFWQNVQMRQEKGLLKPLRFAHAFEVNLSPVSHGIWNQAADGWWVWQLTVCSKGAFSVNLIFNRFRLPGDARLFVFTPGRRHIAGAFTSNNNSESGVFAISPLPGEEITVQYEIPENAEKTADFVITRINHDFLGMFTWLDERRPLWPVVAGSCNRDVNCEIADRWRNVQNSVCRVMVQGTDLCTGTLVNNTAEDKKPYVLTANHCISTSVKAAESLFLFNYESPYCGNVDGDVSNSLSGSKLRATLDSLDFALVELNFAPPPSFRPYYAGWNRSSQPSDTSACIHHPQGETKRIALDNNSPVIATFTSSFKKNGFWNIKRWEDGTTEDGSSGGPLFNRSAQLTGTLSGGAATCINPVNDYFSRFDLAWNYNPDSARQLKHWLDPAKTNLMTCSGKQFNTGDDFCMAYTNMLDGDSHQMLRIKKTGDLSGGFWAGTNSEGITEIAEKMVIAGDEKLYGVSLGIGRLTQAAFSSNSYIRIKVYGCNGPLITLLSSRDTVSLRKLVPDAMNFIRFSTIIEPEDTFLLAVSLENINPGDTLALFHSLRSGKSDNTFILKKNGKWTGFNQENPDKYSSALTLEMVACNVDNSGPDTLDTNQPFRLEAFPNPSPSWILVRSNYFISADMVSVYNLLGQRIFARVSQAGSKQVEIDLSGNSPGFYLIRVRNGSEYAQSKVLYIPR